MASTRESGSLSAPTRDAVEAPADRVVDAPVKQSVDHGAHSEREGAGDPGPPAIFDAERIRRARKRVVSYPDRRNVATRGMTRSLKTGSSDMYRSRLGVDGSAP